MSRHDVRRTDGTPEFCFDSIKALALEQGCKVKGADLLLPLNL